MQNIFNNPTTKVILLSKELPCSLGQCVIVRYLRKPKWLSVEKSKAYVRNNTEVDRVKIMEYNKKINTLRDESKTYRHSKSIWLWQKHLLADADNNTNAQSNNYQKSEVCHSEDMQLRRIVDCDDHENVSIRVKSERDRKLVEEWVQAKREIDDLKRSEETEQDKKLEAATKQVMADMEKIKTSINLEDLDEAIEKAMSSEVDYNFVIDKSGNVIRGRNNNLGSSSTEKMNN